MGIAAFLNENVNRVAVLIYRPPLIVQLTPDFDEDLVQVPNVSQVAFATSEAPSVLGPELPTPLPHGLVGHDNAAFRKEFLDLAKAQRESVVQPDCMTDDFTREPVAAVAIRVRFHPRSVTGTGSS